ncbi:MAG TPA: MFS transporter [Bacillales bacterium]|nr:MFS transporter [Bacillales bacterium]
MTSATRRSFTLLKNHNFFIYGSNALLMPFLPLYLAQGGFTDVQIGLLMAVGPIVSIVSNPFWGFATDRLQKVRSIIFIMLLGALVASQLMFQIHTFLPLFAAMLLFYFFQTGNPPINNTLMLEAVKNSPFHFGTFRLWGSLGFAVTAIASSQVIHWIGLDHLGLIYGVMMLIPLVFCFGLPEPEKTMKRASLKGVGTLFKNYYFVFFLLLSILVAMPNRMNSTFISLYIHQLGGSETYVGWSWFCSAFGEVPVFLLLDRYLKLKPKIMVGALTFVSLLFSIRWLLMGIAQTPLEIVAIQLLHSITFGIYLYAGTHLCEALVSETYRASGQAWYAMFWKGLSGILAGLVGGWIFSWLGPRGMYAIGCAVSLVGTVGFLFMWRQLVKQERPYAPSREVHRGV